MPPAGRRASSAYLAALGPPLCIRRRLAPGRQSALPIDRRAMLAAPDRRTGELVLHVSSQRPHTLRHALAAMLGIAEARLRVMTPDASGGFGARNRLIPEEVVACAPALKLDSPIRWVADRYEHHLMAGAQAREQLCDLTLHATRDGIALGVKGDLRVDAGAYALWPTDGCAEAAAPPRSNPASRRAVLPRARMARCCWRRPRRGGPISRPAARRGDAAGRGGRGTITLTVNGVATVVPGKPRESLAHVRRDRLGLTATGIGRAQGSCRACSALLDGVPVRTCLLPVPPAEGCAVTTLDGQRDDT